MNDTVTAEAAAGELWQRIPLDLVLSAAAIFVAAGLKLAGIFP